jgi:hypothetical protein
MTIRDSVILLLPERCVIMNINTGKGYNFHTKTQDWDINLNTFRVQAIDGEEYIGLASGNNTVGVKVLETITVSGSTRTDNDFNEFIQILEASTIRAMARIQTVTN